MDGRMVKLLLLLASLPGTGEASGIWSESGLGYRPEYGVSSEVLQFSVNSRGWRGEEVAMPKPEHVFRILCVGESTTVEGSADADTYPALLERLLRDWLSTESIEVVNCGVSGGLASAVAAAKSELLALDPDLIVYYGMGIDFVTGDASPVTGSAGGAKGPEGRLACNGRLPDADWMNGDEESLKNVLRESVLKDVSSLVMSMADVNRDTLLCTFASDPRAPGAGALDGAALARAACLYNAVLREMCIGMGYALSDVAGAMQTLDGAFVDAVHMTPEGIRRKAETVADSVSLHIEAIVACREDVPPSPRVDAPALSRDGAFLRIRDNREGRLDGNATNGIAEWRLGAFPEHNVFCSSGLNLEHIYSGMVADDGRNRFTPRRDPCYVTAQSESSACLVWPAANSAWGMACTETIALAGADTVDVDFRFIIEKDCFSANGGPPWIALQWASYMDLARERAIHFWGVADGREQWCTMDASTPGTGNVPWVNSAPLEWEERVRSNPCIIENKRYKFVHPFYYCLVDGDGRSETQDDTLAYIMMFDQAAPVRLGFAVWANGPHGPACDWQYVVHQPRARTEYGYRLRIACKPFTGPEGVLSEYERWSREIRAGK